MVSVENLDKRVEKLEDGMTEIKISLAENNLVTRKNSEISEKFSDTLEIISKTMIELGINTQKNTDMISSMESRFDKMGDWVREVDEKTKIDTATIQRDKQRDLLITGVGAGAIIGLLEILRATFS